MADLDAATSADARIRRLLCEAIAEPTRILGLPPAELDLTIRLLRRARVLGRVASQLRDRGLLAGLPHPLPDILESTLVSAQARARVALWELDRVVWALGGAAPVPLVVLKGCAYLLAGTPNAAGRSFSDVDLLVPRVQLADIEARLLQKGWQSAPLSAYDLKYYREWAHELPALTHPEREVEVDLHHNIVMPTGRLRPPAAPLLEGVRAIPGTPFGVLAPIDMTLHAMTHLFNGGEMDAGLRELLDIADLLAHFGATEGGFWGGFWPRTEALGLGRPAYYGLRYASRWLDAPVPEEVLQASKAAAPPAPVRAIMDAVVQSALFPAHPDLAARGHRMARLATLARSHWVRMPPPMLAKHLGHKLKVRVLGEKPAT